jgi:hypothetical protein
MPEIAVSREADVLGYYWNGPYFPNLITSAAGEKEHLDRYLEESLKPDWWWNDAGWYVNNGNWHNTGTWEGDTKRYPNGLRGLNDYAHAKGMQTIVWFEPERVTPSTWLADTHPEWILGGSNGGLLNLGNPQAWNWLTNHVDKFLTEQGIDHYRQDFNLDPLSYWRKNDTEDRQGITEIKHVTGHLAFWDELRRRHPDMLILPPIALRTMCGWPGSSTGPTSPKAWSRRSGGPLALTSRPVSGCADWTAPPATR